MRLRRRLRHMKKHATDTIAARMIPDIRNTAAIAPALWKNLSPKVKTGHYHLCSKRAYPFCSMAALPLTSQTPVGLAMTWVTLTRTPLSSVLAPMLVKTGGSDKVARPRASVAENNTGDDSVVSA